MGRTTALRKLGVGAGSQAMLYPRMCSPPCAWVIPSLTVKG